MGNRKGYYVSSERAAGGADAGAPFRFKTAEEAHRYVSESGVRQVKLGVADVDGILRGKYVSRDKFLGILEKGFGFCDVIVGWDSNDQLYDNVTYTGWHTGYPDANARVLPATGRLLPFENDMPFFLCELTDAAEAICPRGVLRRVLDKASSMGLRRLLGVRIRVLHVRGDARQRPREELQESEADDARLLWLLGAAQLGARRAVRRPSRDVPRDGHADSRACTPRPGPACSKRPSPSTTRFRPPTRRSCSRPSPRCSRSAAA